MIINVDINPYALEYTINYEGWIITYNGFHNYNFMIKHLHWLIPQIRKRIERLKKIE